MSLRVDLYPLSLPRLASLLGPKGEESERDLLAALRADASPPDEALLSELTSGDLRASQPALEPSGVVALIGRLAYTVRHPEVEVLFDVGSVWNALDGLRPKLRGDERQMARVLLDGRPLVGAKMDTGASAYAWLFARELPMFQEIVGRLRGVPPSELARLRGWLEEVTSRKLDLFVSIG